MVILSKGCKPDKFEVHNSLKLSFMTFRFNFVDCESFLESNLVIYVRQTWITQLILAIFL